MATVKFYTGQQAGFDALTPESNALYFVTDTKRLYKGSVLYADMSQVEEIAAKLEQVENGSEVNVLEEVKVNGSALTISNKSVDIIITTGTADGTVSVNGTDVAVKGLKDAAFKTVEELAAQILSGVSTGTEEIPNPENPEETITVPAAPFLSIQKLETATDGASASYQLVNKEGNALGATIDIPKDMVVQSGDVKTVTTADDPVAGYQVGDRYIDLVLANAANSHVYILVSDLVSNLEAGNGIDITNNVISVAFAENGGLKVDETTGKVTVDLEDLLANSGSENEEDAKPGLVTAEEKAKLEDLAVIEPSGEIGEDGERIPDGAILIDGEKVQIYSHPTTTAVTPAFVKVGHDGLGHVVIGDAITKDELEAAGVASTTVATDSADGLMSSDDKKNLDAAVESLQWGTF